MCLIAFLPTIARRRILTISFDGDASLCFLISFPLFDIFIRFICTSTTTDDEQTAATTQKQLLKRRKVAIFFAYYGVGYQGMQKNPSAKTIQGDLEEAIYLSGAVPEQDRLSVEVWVVVF
ncbi:PREDICTED: uncharacterized protein LOC101302720 [Fragaria vesca subsp. vesca]